MRERKRESERDSDRANWCILERTAAYEDIYHTGAGETGRVQAEEEVRGEMSKS